MQGAADEDVDPVVQLLVAMQQPDEGNTLQADGNILVQLPSPNPQDPKDVIWL